MAPAIKARDGRPERCWRTFRGRADGQAKPIAGTPVSLLKGKEIVATAFADKDGKFSFEQVKSGSYVIAFREGTSKR